MAASPSVTERIVRAARARRGLALTPEETQELATLAPLWGDVLTELDAFESRFRSAMDAVEGRRARTAGVAGAPPLPLAPPAAAPVFSCGGGGAPRPPAAPALALVHPWLLVAGSRRDREPATTRGRADGSDGSAMGSGRRWGR